MLPLSRVRRYSSWYSHPHVPEVPERPLAVRRLRAGYHHTESKVDFGASDPSGKAAAETEARYRHGSIQRDERAFAPAQKVCIRNQADTGH